jgi:hypothetical protein
VGNKDKKSCALYLLRSKSDILAPDLFKKTRIKIAEHLPSNRRSLILISNVTRTNDFINPGDAVRDRMNKSMESQATKKAERGYLTKFVI